MGKQTIQFTGIVKEVRTFGQCVILFLTVSNPKKLRNKVVRFCVTSYNCPHPLSWAKVEVGAEVAITRKCRAEDAENVYYSLNIIKSEVVDANFDF